MIGFTPSLNCIKPTEAALRSLKPVVSFTMFYESNLYVVVLQNKPVPSGPNQYVHNSISSVNEVLRRKINIFGDEACSVCVCVCAAGRV